MLLTLVQNYRTQFIYAVDFGSEMNERMNGSAVRVTNVCVCMCVT